MHYYLAPFEWVIQEDESKYWAAPFRSDCKSVLDLRPISARATAGGTPQGYGLFSYEQEQTIPNSIYLGNDINQLQNKKAAAGIFGALSSNSIKEMLVEVLTVKSDPTGEIGPRPLMPDSDLNLDVFLGGERIHTEKVDIETHPAKDKFLAVIQADYAQVREIDTSVGSDHYLRILGAYKQKYKVADESIFIPSNLPKETALTPATTLGDTFDRADNADINASDSGKTLNGSAATWDWTVTDYTPVIKSNGLDGAHLGDRSQGEVRLEYDLSSADHRAVGETVGNNIASNRWAPMVRFSSSADTCYLYKMGGSGGTYVSQLFSRVTGTDTEIGTYNEQTNSGHVIEVSANGSTIKGLHDTVERVSVTNTSITGNTRVGLHYFSNGPNRAGFAWMTAEDLSSGTSANVSPAVQVVTFSIPTPSVSTETNAIILSSTLSVTISIPLASISAVRNATITPSAQSLIGSIPAPTILAVQNASIFPGAQTLTFSTPTSSVSVETNAVISVGVQSLIFTIPSLSVSTQRKVSFTASVQVINFSIPTLIVTAYSPAEWNLKAKNEQGDWGIKSKIPDGEPDKILTPDGEDILVGADEDEVLIYAEAVSEWSLKSKVI